MSISNIIIQYCITLQCQCQHLSRFFSPPGDTSQISYYQSITATSLGPGLTEVLLFGGRLEYWGDLVAETTILIFGERVDTSVGACVGFKQVLQSLSSSNLPNITPSSWIRLLYYSVVLRFDYFPQNVYCL